jgi:hypothetical protein
MREKNGGEKLRSDRCHCSAAENFRELMTLKKVA